MSEDNGLFRVVEVPNPNKFDGWIFLALVGAMILFVLILKIKGVV